MILIQYSFDKQRNIYSTTLLSTLLNNCHWHMKLERSCTISG